MDLESVSFSTLLIGNVLLVTGLVMGLSILDPGRNAGRAMLAFSAILLGIRYLVWRWAETMTWNMETIFGFCWPLIFAVTETLRQFDCLHAIFTLSVTTDHRADADRHEVRLKAMPVCDLPWVDVFIPTYAEPRDVVYRTLIGTRALDYPRFRVFILDDGSRPWLRALCADEGVTYIGRQNGKHAKAGNINHGLATTRGPDAAPFILMLDADFVPYRQFLWRTLGFFEDNKIAIVQTPQYFFNPDPAQMNLGSPANWAEEQRFFFDAMQPSKDAWDMAFCCGSSCIVRRAAIEAVGGVPEGAVIEDIHLSYVLLAHGYITRYLNETLSNGMASETIGEFARQRVRWALGCAQSVRLRFGPFGRNGLSLMQRIFYLSTISYWTNLIFLLVYMGAPSIYWVSGTSAYNADLAGLAVYQAPYLIASQAFMIWAGRGRIIPAVWEGVQMVFAFDVVRSVYPMLLTGKVRATRATAKGLSVDRKTVNWRLLRIVGGFAVVNLLSLCWGQLDSLRDITSRSADQVNIFWSLNALLILGISMMLCIERPRRRAEPRFKVGEAVGLMDGRQAVLEDISLSGVRLRLSDAPATVAFRWRGLPTMTARRVRAGAGWAGYRITTDPGGARALTTMLFAGGFEAQTYRIRFGSFLGTLCGRLLLSGRG